MALLTIVSKTGWTSVGELLITRRISPVAVRSRLRPSSSVNSRTFSIAMTAWSAKVFSSSICLSENDRAERHAFPQQRDAEDRAVAELSSEGAAFWELLCLGLKIRHMNGPPLKHAAPRDGIPHDRQQPAHVR